MTKANSKTTELNLDQFGTVSAKIRYLTEQGYKRTQIAKLLNIRYQHVRNVQLSPQPKRKELL